MFREIDLEENFIYDIINEIDVFKYSIYKQINYKKIFDIAIQQKIFPTICYFLQDKINAEAFIPFAKEKQRLRLKSAIVKHQIKAIVNCFREHKIKFAISKGIAHANELYKDHFLRDMNDIDIVIKADDYLKGCELLESIGYTVTEAAIDKTAYYEANRSQCTFVKSGCLSVELKDRIQYVWQSYLEQWFDRVEYKEIGGITVPVFSTEDMFINILVNCNKNMSTPYGIDNDYRIKDLFELYLFINKNQSIFTEEFVNMLTADGYAQSLSCMMDYCEEFFTKSNFEKIPQTLRQARITDYGKDHVKWNIPILKRFFDEENRTREHHLFRFGNYFNDDRYTSYISDGNVISLNLTDYAKSKDIKLALTTLFDKDKVHLIFDCSSLDFDVEHYIRVRISDPSNIDYSAYRTNIIRIKNGEIEYTTETDSVSFDKEKSLLMITCEKETIFFEENSSFFISVLLSEFHHKTKEPKKIGEIGGNIKLRKFVLKQ